MILLLNLASQPVGSVPSLNRATYVAFPQRGNQVLDRLDVKPLKLPTKPITQIQRQQLSPIFHDDDSVTVKSTIDEDIGTTSIPIGTLGFLLLTYLIILLLDLLYILFQLCPLLYQFPSQIPFPTVFVLDLEPFLILLPQ